MSSSHRPFHQKYRPTNLDELVGQELISVALKQAILTNKIAPAYLFCGPRGTGKTSSARIFAKSLNCLNHNKPDPIPCNQCSLCKEISLGNALDIIEIDAASNTGVENIREIIERARFAPTQARWKVYVIDECHMLSTAASNALLKTIEEPPDQVIFILATTNPEKVLNTIQSRCQKYDFHRIATEHICKHLLYIAKKESIVYEELAIELIAKRSSGGMRDAQSLLDQLSLLPEGITSKNVSMLLGEVSEYDLINLINSLIRNNAESLIETCSELYDLGNEPIAILEGLLNITRDLLLKKTTNEYSNLFYTSKEFYPELNKLSKLIDKPRIIKWHNQLKNIEYQIKSSNQARLWLEINLSSLIELDLKENLEKTSNKIFEVKINKPEGKNIDAVVQTEKKNIDDNAINLKEKWSLILSKLELPSTRMLLYQQAELSSINENFIEISLSPNWENMIKSRKIVIENAVRKIFGKNMNVKFTSEKKTETIIKSTNINSVEKPKSEISLPREKVLEENLNVKDKQTSNNTDPSNNQMSSKNLAQFFNGEIIDIN